MASDWAYIPGFDREKEQYVKLDLGTWIKRNAIKDEGARQGKGNQPPRHADNLDETEAKILDWVNDRAKTCRNDVTNHLGDLERELATTDIDPNLEPKAKNIASRAKAAVLEIDEVVDRHRDHLPRQTEAVLQAKSDYDEFRRDAELRNRPADYGQRGSAIWVIVGCFVVEVVLNASLLMEVNAFGLVGAAFQMALISAVNIFVFGFAMGELLRQAHHVSLGRRALAWPAMGLLLAFAALFNLAIGHFRDSMEAILTDPAADVFMIGADTLDRFVDSPWGLDSFQSALLAFVGLLFFCVASWKWLHRDDVYPGYGRRHRFLEEVQDEYSGWRKDVCDQLKHKYKQHQSTLDDEYHQLQMICPKAFEVRARAKKIVDDYPIHLSQYDHHLEFLLAAYRTANLSARTEPAPPHFDAKEHVDKEILEPPAFAPPPESDLTRVFESVDVASSELQGKYAEALRRFPPLDDLLPRAGAARPFEPNEATGEASRASDS